jgi:hypothetical protein
MHGEKTRHVPYKHRALGTEIEEKKIKSRGDDIREKTEERTHNKKNTRA